MKPANVRLLRIICWLLNIMIVGLAGFGLGAVVLFFRGASHAPGAAANSNMLFEMGLAGLFRYFLRTVYFLGILRILVLLNKALNRVVAEKRFSGLSLRYIQSIGVLLLLTPLPPFLAVLMAFPMLNVFMALLTGWNDIYLCWPYCLAGLIVLVASGNYKKGLDYKEKPDMTA